MELHNLELSALMDMLSDQTAIYTRLLAERHRTKEFEHAKEMIKRLQAEISFRKNVFDKSPERNRNLSPNREQPGRDDIT